jgi:hypothetical protein
MLGNFSVAEILAASREGISSTELVFSSLKVHQLYEPGYVISRVGNLTEEKSCRYVWISHRVSSIWNLLKIEASNSLMVTEKPASPTADTYPLSQSKWSTPAVFDVGAISWTLLVSLRKNTSRNMGGCQYGWDVGTYHRTERLNAAGLSV